jgi:hypothetical protein
MPLTLLDIAKQNGNDKIIGLVEEVNLIVPEVRIFPARTIKGTTFKTLVRTAYPTVGFRKANNGTDAVKSAYENRLFECRLIDGRMEVDKAVADAAEDGAEVVKAREAVGYMGGAMAGLAQQIWYGTDADGFPGFVSLVDSTMQIGNLAANLTASTGSSVFAVNLSELSGAALVLGGNGQGILGQTMDWRVESITGQNGKKLTGYVTDLPAWIGLQNLSKYCVARLDNLTEDSGKGLTDAWLAKLVNLFEEKNNGIRPTHLFCNYRSRSQLQTARTVVLNGQGRTRPEQPAVAPVPTDYDGIPIVATTAISKTEAIVARS